MYNYYCYAKSKKKEENSIKESKAIKDNNLVKTNKIKKMIEHRNEMLKKSIQKLAENPVVIHKYKDSLSSKYFISSNIFREENTEKNIQLKKDINIDLINEIQKNSFKDNIYKYKSNKQVNNNKSFMKSFKCIKLPETDLDRIYNSIVKYLKEGTSKTLIKYYANLLTIKFKNYRNNSAFEEYYKTNKKTKIDLIELLGILINIIKYENEFKSSISLIDNLNMIKTFLIDNFDKYIIINDTENKNMSYNNKSLYLENNKCLKHEHINNISKNYNQNTSKFIRDKYRLVNSKIKTYININENIFNDDGITSYNTLQNKNSIEKICKKRQNLSSAISTKKYGSLDYHFNTSTHKENLNKNIPNNLKSNTKYNFNSLKSLMINELKNAKNENNKDVNCSMTSLDITVLNKNNELKFVNKLKSEIFDFKNKNNLVLNNNYKDISNLKEKNDLMSITNNNIIDDNIAFNLIDELDNQTKEDFYKELNVINTNKENKKSNAIGSMYDNNKLNNLRLLLCNINNRNFYKKIKTKKNSACNISNELNNNKLNNNINYIEDIDYNDLDNYNIDMLENNKFKEKSPFVVIKGKPYNEKDIPRAISKLLPICLKNK